jgi:hypothetical protein
MHWDWGQIDGWFQCRMRGFGAGESLSTPKFKESRCTHGNGTHQRCVPGAWQYGRQLLESLSKALATEEVIIALSNEGLEPHKAADPIKDP